MPNASDAAAMAEFEKLLMATSRVTIRYLGGSKNPAVATLALDLDGMRAMSLVVYIDPKKKKTTGVCSGRQNTRELTGNGSGRQGP